MPREVRLPGADELFRPTHGRAKPTRDPGPIVPEVARTSGRVRHDEKITVYVTADELLAVEQARLALRAEHGIAVDRGRIIREAILAAVEDLRANGGAAALVRRLGDR